MRKRKKNVQHANKERWLITYADLITLLMIFFILLYTMAKLDTKKFAAISQSLKNAIGTTEGKKIDIVKMNRGTSAVLLSPQGELPENKGGDSILRDEKLKNAKKDLEKQIGVLNDGAGIEVIVQERGLVIRIASKVLFATGSAEILPESEGELNKIAKVLESLGNQIRVEGFSDSQPINSVKYPSNWELSGARAFNVLKYIMANSKIEPGRLAAIGYGEYRPLDPKKNVIDRPEDRRVDIVVVQSDLKE